MKFVPLVAALAAAFAVPAQAQTQAQATSEHAGHHAQAAPGAAAAAPAVEGEVRKVDKEQGKLTLRHGPIPNLEMGGMTMIFRVADPKLLDGLKAGDKVTFTAAKVDGAFTVMTIVPAR